MSRKKIYDQEPLFDPGSLDEPLAEVPGSIKLGEFRETDEKDLSELGEITDTAKEEADLEEVAQLGRSALAPEVQIAVAEDLALQDEITDHEQARIDNLVQNGGISERVAEMRVLGKERALALRGEEIPKPAKRKRKSGGRRGNLYPKGHPKKISQRIRTAGDANSGDPDLR